MIQRLLGNRKQPLLFVISAPAGTGKSTLVHLLLEEFAMALATSCSSTTRKPRLGEIAEQHYEFISVDEFEKKIASGAFLEYAKVFGNYYGTRKQEIERIQKAGKHAILVIDTQGALKIKQQIQEGKYTPSTIFIFISPPSLEELRRRLFMRRTEDEEKIHERLQWAEQEISLATHYDYHIVNENLEMSYQVLRSIFIAEEHKV